MALSSCAQRNLNGHALMRTWRWYCPDVAAMLVWRKTSQRDIGACCGPASRTPHPAHSVPCMAHVARQPACPPHHRSTWCTLRHHCEPADTSRVGIAGAAGVGRSGFSYWPLVYRSAAHRCDQYTGAPVAGTLRRCAGRPRALYLQLLLSFPLLTLLLPSATTRTGILIYVYDQALELSHVPRGAPLAKAIMLALNSVNRLASTVLLTGGITPVVAAALIGGIAWSRWLVLMSVPYGVLLAIAAGLIYGLYKDCFSTSLPIAPQTDRVPFSGAEKRTALITLNQAIQHWHTGSTCKRAMARHLK